MMQALNEKKWKKFETFDKNGFLHIAATRSSIDGIRLKEGEKNTIPYITRTDLRNGIARFVSEENLEYGYDNAGCITIGLDTQTAFYQQYKFVTGQNIHVVTGASLDKDTALFYVPILRSQMDAKFNWGGNGATLGRMRRLETLLPVNEDGEMDFRYMQQYVYNMRNSMLSRSRAYIEKKIAEIGEVANIPALNEKEWAPIFIADMFNLVRGKEGNMAMLSEGDIPLISAKNTNNGLKGFVKSPKKSISGHCITLNNDGDGGAGFAYYQPADMALDTHVTALIPKYLLSKWSMLFIAECLSGLHDFFGHGLSISNKRANKIKIMLPVNLEGCPDYDYMEQYAKNMMLKKYKQYLNYLDAKEKQLNRG